MEYSMSNDTLYTHFQTNRLIKRRLLPFGMLFQLTLLLWIYYFCRDMSISSSATPLWIGKRGLIVVTIAEFLFLSLSLPLMGSHLLPTIDERDYDIVTILPHRQGMIYDEILSAGSLSFLMILPVVIPLGYLHTWGIPFAIILRLFLTLFFTGLLLISINLFISSIVKDSSASIPISYLTIFSLTGGVILMNPLIEWVSHPEMIIQPTLLLNPFIAITSAINLDVLRTDPIYYLSTISTFQFHYPHPIHFWFIYSIISAGLFIVKYLWKGDRK